MNVDKKLIFISHAQPEDDYLAVWLASKLRQLGYEVWVDKDNLKKGDAFWNEIELRIKNDSLRFIPLVSKAYINKSLDKDTGVFLEVSLSKSISRKIDNYIIPLKVDGCSYDDFPISFLPLDSIDFSQNWGKGLKELVEELELQDIPKSAVEPNVLQQWHKYLNIHGKVVDRSDFYGSNWLPSTLPKTISIYRFTGDAIKAQKEIPFAKKRDKDYILGFFNDSGLDLRTEFREDVALDDFLFDDTYILNSGDLIKGTRLHFTQLMNSALDEFFYQHENIKCWRKKSKERIYYTRKPPKESGSYPFKIDKKKGRRTLKGKKGDIHWNYSLSFKFQLDPFPHFVTNPHLLISDENGFKDDNQKYRRSIPKEWFNRHWYDRIFAFMNYVNDGRDERILRINSGREAFELDIRTSLYKSDKGYDEPKTL
ncbi:hypothetical protein Oweho_0536 [Owenweeksia hongkongensis DSM 17368]|uniref:TIR domain-containing protein n=1 Tax=Owenweeksia hongkongensis (strain DSM 17368 / CIP 108786 / JCM 12287 / NRRL B-23963 / UST20020801) TaxID=926562 RepID=G8QZV8_OWEHD|nr:toll/interleukin-1 receptor domain-containing protein [Owenweeksia hongkongensis]AEV31552.1 hypothetical protein Oweho_0536 [Owenweeksia hongkongensis DSM 17368]